MGSTVFVHAGFTPTTAAMGMDALNEDWKQGHGQSEFWFHGESPLWTRLYGGRELGGVDDETRCEELEKTFKTLGNGVERMVIGHNPQQSNRFMPTVTCDGKLFVMDTGISAYYRGKSSAVRINTANGQEKVFVITPNQSRYIPPSK